MKRAISALLLILFSLNAFCQEPDTFESRYEQFKRFASDDFQAFRAACNEKYAQFLAASWKNMELLPAVPKPKDEEITPVIRREEDSLVRNNQTPIKEIIEPIKVDPRPEPIFLIRDEEKQSEPVDERVFQMFGTTFTLSYSTRLDGILSGSKDESPLWQALSTSADMDGVLKQSLSYREDMRLCDWAYLQFCVLAGERMAKSKKAARVVSSYILANSGYKVRLARKASDKLILLFACDSYIYGMASLWIGGQRYYAYDGVDGSISVCEAGYDGEKPLSLAIDKQPLFAVNLSEPRVCTSTKIKDLSVSISVNTNLVDFYATYPSSCYNNNFMTRWAFYANAPMEESVTEDLYPVLKEGVSGKTKLEAVNCLLNFVHKSFPYGYDSEIWGGDRAFFAEETFYYPKSDCEDHAILFSRLIRDILHLPVVLVYYPGHLATAVAFPEEVAGDYLLVNGQKFTICDPTYFGSHVGQTMPGMDNSKVSVILLDF